LSRASGRVASGVAHTGPVRRLVGSLVVLAVLLVGADFGLRFLAARQIGDAVRQRLDLPQRPDVSVAGFPFLVQAIEGRYDGVSARLPATTLGPLGGVTAAVELIGVRLPFSDAVSGNVDRLTADSARARLAVPVGSIAAAAGLPGLQVTSDDGGLTLSATVTAVGRQFPITARLDAEVVDSTLTLRSGSISGAGVTVPPEAVAALGALVDLAVPLDGLPFTVTGGRISVSGTDVVVDATASALNLSVR
jgi:hypothetical protein